MIIKNKLSKFDIAYAEYLLDNPLAEVEDFAELFYSKTGKKTESYKKETLRKFLAEFPDGKYARYVAFHNQQFKEGTYEVAYTRRRFSDLKTASFQRTK